MARSTSISQSPFHFLPPSASKEPFGHRATCSWLIILSMCCCSDHTEACRHTRPYRSFAFRYWSTCHIRTDLPCKAQKMACSGSSMLRSYFRYGRPYKETATQFSQ